MPNRSPITIDGLIRDVSTVHSLPLFYSRLEETINHPRSSISDIAKIISEDQGLTARVLRLSNSPLFGYFSRIETIPQAVTVIGVQQVRELALSLSVMDVFKGLPEDLVNMDQFWRHSIATGIAARVLATHQREANLERFFVAGILHDIGRLLMFIRLPEVCREMLEDCRTNRRLLHVVERERLTFDHADVGGSLLRKWKIPPRIAEPVEFHHRPRFAEQYPREASLMHLADIVVHAMDIGRSGGAFVPTLEPQAWTDLGTSAEQLASVVKKVDALFEETILALFGSKPNAHV